MAGDERESKPTVALDPRTITSSWPIVLAQLEQIKPWAGDALARGILSMIIDCTRRMAATGIEPGLVNELQDYVNVLRHMPTS